MSALPLPWHRPIVIGPLNPQHLDQRVIVHPQGGVSFETYLAHSGTGMEPFWTVEDEEFNPGLEKLAEMVREKMLADNGGPAPLAKG